MIIILIFENVSILKNNKTMNGIVTKKYCLPTFLLRLLQSERCSWVNIIVVPWTTLQTIKGRS